MLFCTYNVYKKKAYGLLAQMAPSTKKSWLECLKVLLFHLKKKKRNVVKVLGLFGF